MQTVIKNPNWWRRRTTLEICLTLVSIIAFIAVTGLVSVLVCFMLTNHMSQELKTTTPASIALALHGRNTADTVKKVPCSHNKTRGRPTYAKRSDVCLTAECTQAAKETLSKMKTEIEPCDDFYQFACGTFIEETQIPKDKVIVDTFSAVTDKLQEQLKDIITTERPASDPKHFRLPNALYKACMNKNLIESLGPKPITQIAQTLGGWPVLVGNSWNSDNSWSWQETVKKFRRMGLSEDYVVDFSIGVELTNTAKRIIDLDQASLGLDVEYLVNGFNETLVSAYFDYMVDIAVLFGAEKETAKMELRESLQFEMDLAQISLPEEKRRNSNDLYNLRTIKQLQEDYPYVQWLDYINDLLHEGLNVEETEVINLKVPSFFEDLGKLLERTKKRAIANYMMWRIHDYSVSFLSEEFRKIQLQYDTALSGRQEEEPRWKECVQITAESTLSISVGSLYVRKYFNQESKTIALEMVNNIRGIFQQILDDVKWMDDITKQKAKEKLQAMATYIGYPDEMLDNEKLSEYYHNLEIDPDKYFESYLKMNVFDTESEFSKLRLPVDKTDWLRHSDPAVVNAFYSPLENSIQIPAGILQGHFFNAQRPKFMNYAAIGYVMGHEMTHCLDDEGRQFDPYGNLVDWWQPETDKAYLKKAQCVIDQYSNYIDKQTGLHVNGINTQGENIADNGGIKESYLAYKQWVSQNGEELKLPGLNYSPQQMFWISYAQTWCSVYRTEYLKMRITTNPHSPNQFRVMGSISNMKDFSRDFQCPEGSPMNPVKKCEVW